MDEFTNKLSQNIRDDKKNERKKVHELPRERSTGILPKCIVHNDSCHIALRTRTLAHTIVITAIACL